MKTVSPLRSSKRNGFTLFEVTVAIPILLSLTTLAILGVRDYLKGPPPSIIRSDSSEIKASLIESGLLTPVRNSRPSSSGASASPSRKVQPLVIPELRPPTVVGDRAGTVTESKRK
jgi:hypothetical protein